MKAKILFLLLTLASLWLGAYAMEVLSGTWAQFPTYITAVSCFFGGIAGFFLVD